MRTLLSVVAALALTVGVYADKSPTQAGQNTYVVGGHINVPPPQFNPGDEIYNSLSITDNQTYINGNGDAYSGQGIFGSDSDLQFVDDVRFEEDCCVDVAVRDHLTFFGTGWTNYQVALYADNGNCAPNEAADCDTQSGNVGIATFSDTVFGLLGVRSSVQTDGSCCVPAGNYFVETRAYDPGTNGDWGYTPRDGVQVGCDSHLRDGGIGNPGYGTFTWVSSGTYGYGVGTVAQALSVKCGPPKPRCIYQVNKVKNMATLCGAVCDSCPYVRGDLVCTNECPNGGADCRTRLKGFNACGNGAACKVIADLVGCDIPPRNCKRCR
ncbi:MAG: hypothetical protein IT449_00315 [Phycisphaerales bacterium]|nr:hypothetical protein [Phycisphaerales bacterium]